MFLFFSNELTQSNGDHDGDPASNYMLKLTIETLEQGVKYAQN